MKNNEITQRDFIIRQLPQVTVEGTMRKAFIGVSDLKIEDGADELNKGMKKIIASFSLPKGSYATVVIKALFDAR